MTRKRLISQSCVQTQPVNICVLCAMLVCVTSLDESGSSDSDVPSDGPNGTPPKRTQLRIGNLKKEMQHILQQSGFDGTPDPMLPVVDENYSLSQACDSCHSDDSTSFSSRQYYQRTFMPKDESIQDIWRVFNERKSTDNIERLGKCIKMIRNELIQMRERDQTLIKQLLSAHHTMHSIACSQYSDTWDSDSTFPEGNDLSDDGLIDIKDIVGKIPPLRRRRQSAPDYEDNDEQEVYDPLSMSSPLFLSSCYDWKTHQVTLL